MSCEIYEGENLVLDNFVSNNGMTYSHKSPIGDNSSYSSNLVLIIRNRNFEDVIFFKKNLTVTNFHK